jgi:hypothetical protein
MGLLYQARVKIEQAIQARGLPESQVKGKLSLKSGVLLAFVHEDTPDDPAKLEKLRAAARELLGIDV